MERAFTPEIWREDPPPPAAAGYELCEVCSGKSRLIWGEGNPGAPVAVILDNPGAREDRAGAEFVCGTRQTLQKAICEAGMGPGDFYLTYLLKCRPLKKYDREKARQFSLPFLAGQIDSLRPRLLLCLGDTVAQAVLGDGGAHIKDLRGEWRAAFGRPALFSYHPLAVRRRPNLASRFAEDFEALARALKALPPSPGQLA